MFIQNEIFTEYLRNATEQIVFDEICLLLDTQTIPFCSCDICMQDIAAISLNNLPSWYMTEIAMGQAETSRSYQMKLKIIQRKAKIAVAEAITKVFENRHCATYIPEIS